MKWSLSRCLLLGWLAIESFLAALGFLFVMRMLKDSDLLPMTPLVRVIITSMTICVLFGSLYSHVRASRR